MLREIHRSPVVDVAIAFLRLGLTSFGGPVAHVGYFRAAFVARRRWLDDHEFAALAALCQALPGPTSSQLGCAIGYRRAGLAGAFVAWLAFTLPSALLLTVAALVPLPAGAGPGAALRHGFALAAVAVVAQAVLVMSRTLAPDPPRVLVAAVAAAITLLLPGGAGQLVAIVAGAGAGLRWAPAAPLASGPTRAVPRNGLAVVCLAVLVLLAGSFAGLAGPAAPAWLQLASACFSSGALVFGGGHVVLPLLGAAVVDPGLMSAGDFLAGYGFAQAVPGPLFSIGAWVGAQVLPMTPWVGAAIGLVMVFLPGLLLVLAALPAWGRLTANGQLRRALAGINAAVLGLLAAALYDPLALVAIRAPEDAVLAAGGLALLVAFRGRPAGSLLAVATTVTLAVLLAQAP
jgi:chromate transporter